MGDSESFLLTVPSDWDLNIYATERRKFGNVQDYIRELIRRDIEAFQKEENNNKTNQV